MSEFSDWFESVTGKPPFPYQERFALSADLPLFLSVMTGAGKTATAILGWFWRRRNFPEQTPRRLVYCLPMRSLVEQTYQNAQAWLKDEDVDIHLLMGGAVSNNWEEYPDRNCIIIGTQDQLLSRALNRGYSMSRYKWPVHFALLNNDCLWVMDEVQLMGAGLQTTAQLQGFREKFNTYGQARSLWMSATLNPEFLATVDYQPDFNQRLELADADLQHPILKQRWEAKKPLLQAQVAYSRKDSNYGKTLAAQILQVHQPGSLTLVICNQVNRAQTVYAALKKQAPDEPVLLIHSRFRPSERQALNERLSAEHLTGIVVATQTVEAGVDLSARVLFTELAPWSSMVQRFGRCNRMGKDSQTAQVYWIDLQDIEKKDVSAPYDPQALQAAKEILRSLTDVGPCTLSSLENTPVQPPEGLIPRQRDLLQLFDTTTDLAGHDLDVSSFIRDTPETDIAIAWRTWDDDEPPSDWGSLQQDELCRVSLVRAKELLDKVKNQHSAWVWDRVNAQWQRVSYLYPGMSLLLHTQAGGYETDLGFTGNPKQVPTSVYSVRAFEPLDSDSRDDLSYIGEFVTLRQHSQDVAEEIEKLCQDLSEIATEADFPRDLIIKAARWHDAGKAHPEFQKMLTSNRPESSSSELWAKSGRDWRKNLGYQMPPDRRGFRHELVSALLAIALSEEFLLAYLVACHHGKVRMTIQPRPYETPPQDRSIELYALGVHEGDWVPDPVAEIDLGNGLKIPQQVLSLQCMRLGKQAEGELSWGASAIALLDEYGPFKLAFLETLIRVADWRGSQRRQSQE
ncbi:MAG: CRISPR-associated helicase Cas3' [Desertifilum sp.]|nr:CRISPR-associated helicase Cas3' [Desertifilum sp.]